MMPREQERDTGSRNADKQPARHDTPQPRTRTHTAARAAAAALAASLPRHTHLHPCPCYSRPHWHHSCARKIRARAAAAAGDCFSCCGGGGWRCDVRCRPPPQTYAAASACPAALRRDPACRVGRLLWRRRRIMAGRPAEGPREQGQGTDELEGRAEKNSQHHAAQHSTAQPRTHARHCRGSTGCVPALPLTCTHAPATRGRTGSAACVRLYSARAAGAAGDCNSCPGCGRLAPAGRIDCRCRQSRKSGQLRRPSLASSPPSERQRLRVGLLTPRSARGSLRVGPGSSRSAAESLWEREVCRPIGTETTVHRQRAACL